ncbi:hypothetical protein GOP47_0015537 [Adiantum capillus-veneris]|uniref:Uncharacterized protein n=1 Tax=Adiantum capillus-veneris TaxID=13818 RepID=A0A9D4ZE23_ADICA|nr:hypothetical protein GOP47_0015537 [Adiantum capillus-veneris]
MAYILLADVGNIHRLQAFILPGKVVLMEGCYRRPLTCYSSIGDEEESLFPVMLNWLVGYIWWSADRFKKTVATRSCIWVQSLL